jgi:hypothetical protein
MVTACVIYEIKSGLDTEALYDRLTSGASYDTDGSEVETLITDVGNVEKTERGVEFIARYDVEETRPVREHEDPWFAALHKVTVRVTDQFFILNGFDSRSKAAKEVARILELDNDEFKQVDFNSAALISLVTEDADELSQGTWDNPTELADAATVWGELQDSALYTEFNSGGKPSWAKFESTAYPEREAGVSTNKNSVVFGSSWKLSEMEDYIFEKVIPSL